jgi:hypothetical protein
VILLNKKTLLHRASFAVLTALCCAAMSQTPTPNTSESTAPSTTLQAPKADTKASLQAQEIAAKTQHSQTMQACAVQLAPAQCQRQARLDYKQADHVIKQKRDALDVQAKQSKHAQHLAQKAQANARANDSAAKNAAAHVAASSNKQLKTPSQSNANANANANGNGNGNANANAGTNVFRSPLVKQGRAKKSPDDPVNHAGNNAASGVGNTTSSGSNNIGKGAPPKRPKPISSQPSAEQRRANVAQAAQKESLITARKDKAQANRAKRQAKMAAHQAKQAQP